MTSEGLVVFAVFGVVLGLLTAGLWAGVTMVTGAGAVPTAEQVGGLVLFGVCVGFITGAVAGILST